MKKWLIAGIMSLAFLGLVVYFATRDTTKYTGFYYLHAAGLNPQDEVFKHPNYQSDIDQFTGFEACRHWAEQVRLRSKLIGTSIGRPPGEPEDLIICRTACHLEENKNVKCEEGMGIRFVSEIETRNEMRRIN